MRPIRALKRFFLKVCPSFIPLLRSPSIELKSTAVPAGILAVFCTNFSTFILLIGASYKIMSSHFSRSQTLTRLKFAFVSEVFDELGWSVVMTIALVSAKELLEPFV